MTALGGIGLRPRRTIPRTICLAEASGCSEGRAMSRSFIARTRAQSALDLLEEDGLLMLRGFAKGDDSNNAWTLDVNNRDHKTPQHSQSDKSFLGIGKTRVLK